ncbi:MAG: extracellular solute-binding protein [Lachnospiraceae bacterium]|uniref:extracellular solute-binding protein n=1 Tax=Roseburia hominis TaxID=301301 RepID=UPI001F1A7CFA|nr:extracellular solute-binding protein [Roseburia hominis]MDD6169862.1 extracellular solute-binding protein [Lachnospiraceae bacterium]MDY4840452.1 extracellular solute-binding protein [Lachnospiraceae bacterium]
MRRKIAMILCATMVTTLFAGCGSGTENTVATSTEEGKEETSANEGEVVSIWHDGDEAIMKVIEDQVNEELSDDNITVKFEKKSGLTDQIKLYGNDAESGPDMYMYAHDSLGTFVEMGVLSPITDVVDESVYADMLPMTQEAGNYKGEQYLLPVYFETLLFMYNKDLWEGEVPSTTEDLYAYMQEHTDADAGTYAVVNQHSTAYNVSPFINGFGGYIIDEDANPGLTDEKTKEAIEYNKKFAELQADGDYNTVTTLFNEGKAAAIVGGPWLISGIKDAGINLGIKSLSDFTLPNGNSLAPYSGIQGVGVMKHAAEEKKDAVAKVLTAISDPEVGIALAKEASCAPANQKAYEDEAVKSDEMIAAMERTAETAEPMPNIPEMSVMWGPAESLLAAVNKSGDDLDAAAEQYQKEAEAAITDMQ